MENLVGKKIYSFNVKVKKLDNFKFIKKVKIIKIDVEGDELNVLLGANYIKLMTSIVLGITTYWLVISKIIVFD